MFDKKSKYNKEINIPIKIAGAINMPRTGFKAAKKMFARFPMLVYCSVIVISLIVIQSALFAGFEAYVVNVTAHICNYSETRTIGFWKNHSLVYENYLPQDLGNEIIDTVEAADEVFKNAKAEEMRSQLKAQLLAMKFNIVNFGIGEYFVESEGKTLEIIAAEGDYLLKQDPEPTRDVLENLKDILDNLNNLHQIKYCSEINNLVVQEQEELVINGEQGDSQPELVVFDETTFGDDQDSGTTQDNNSVATTTPQLDGAGLADIDSVETTSSSQDGVGNNI
ncbi:hypothetical protein ACFL11_00280 [Patescibacteria group bacterium]